MDSIQFIFPGESLGASPLSQGVLFDSSNKQLYNTVRRYTAAPGDVIIGVITHKTPDFYRVDIRGSAPAILATTAFNGATKRHKPEVKVGNHVLAWVSRVDPDLDVELSCEDSGTQRDWSSGDCLFGILSLENSDSALVVDVSTSYAAQLQMKDAHPVLRSFARHAKAEIAVGRNGRVFLKAASRAEVLALSKTLLFGERLSPVQTEALFRGLLNQ